MHYAIYAYVQKHALQDRPDRGRNQQMKLGAGEDDQRSALGIPKIWYRVKGMYCLGARTANKNQENIKQTHTALNDPIRRLIFNAVGADFSSLLPTYL